jgi:hypothetical protein
MTHTEIDDERFAANAPRVSRGAIVAEGQSRKETGVPTNPPARTSLG